MGKVQIFIYIVGIRSIMVTPLKAKVTIVSKCNIFGAVKTKSDPPLTGPQQNISFNLFKLYT